MLAHIVHHLMVRIASIGALREVDMGTIWGLDGEMNQKAIGIKGICGSWGIPVYQSFTGFGWLRIFAGKKPFKEDSSKKMIDPLLGIYLGPLVP